MFSICLDNFGRNPCFVKAFRFLDFPYILEIRKDVITIHIEITGNFLPYRTMPQRIRFSSIDYYYTGNNTFSNEILFFAARRPTFSSCLEPRAATARAANLYIEQKRSGLATERSNCKEEKNSPPSLARTSMHISRIDKYTHARTSARARAHTE